MALTRTTYTQTGSALKFQDATISPTTVADGTLAQRFDPLAFPQVGVKQAGTRGRTVAAPVLTLGTVTTSGGTFAAATYFWKITAINPSGEGPVSNEITSAIAINGTAPMSWPAAARATGYKVYRGTASGAENKLVATLGAVLTYTDTGTAGAAVVLPTVDTSGDDIPRAARTTHQ